jgi:hypothetical protein
MGAGEGLFETESSYTVVTIPAIAGGAVYLGVNGGSIHKYARRGRESVFYPSLHPNRFLCAYTYTESWVRKPSRWQTTPTRS